LSGKKNWLSTIPEPRDQRSSLHRKEEMEGINQCRFPAGSSSPGQLGWGNTAGNMMRRHACGQFIK
ncbi:MAG TPA: hypothetical protein VJ323_06460, partial [Bryobacteraceae bacterium]|nr:hypothetical protein [Bryobacteraceae bacterium]